MSSNKVSTGNELLPPQYKYRNYWQGWTKLEIYTVLTYQSIFVIEPNLFHAPSSWCMQRVYKTTSAAVLWDLLN